MGEKKPVTYTSQSVDPYSFMSFARLEGGQPVQNGVRVGYARVEVVVKRIVDIIEIAVNCVIRMGMGDKVRIRSAVFSIRIAVISIRITVRSNRFH